MPIIRKAVEIGPKDGSRRQPVIARVEVASTYAVMPSSMLNMLGVSPEWTSVLELADGSSEEFQLAEILLRFNEQDRTVVCVFGKPDSQPVLGSHTIEAFGLAADPEGNGLLPARLKLT